MQTGFRRPDKLADAATFIRDMRQGFLADLRHRLNGPGRAIEFLRDSMFDVFGPDGLNIILDRDGEDALALVKQWLETVAQAGRSGMQSHLDAGPPQ